MKRPILAFAVGLVVWVIAALTSIIAGAVAAWLAPSSPSVPVLLDTWLTRARPLAGATAGGAGT